MATVAFPEIAQANNAITTLNGAINNSTTTVVLATGGAAALGLSGSTTDAYITVIDRSTWRKNPLTSPETLEIMQVTAVSGDSLTVTRGVDGTSGISFADGSIVELRITAAMIQRIYDALTDGTDDLNIGDLTISTSANTGLLIEANSAGSNLVIDPNSGWGGAAANANADNMVIQFNTTQVGMTIASSTTGSGNIYFGDTSSVILGRIVYANGGPDSMQFWTAGVLALTIDNSQDATFVGDVDASNGDLLIQEKTPASAAATGTKGTIAFDSDYIYICTATNTWKRVAIATW